MTLKIGMRAGFILIALSFVLACSSEAARTLSADQSIVVKLELSQPTALAFPENIAHVTVGLDEKSFSADKDGPYLFLICHDPALTGRLFVVGQSGKLYTVLFKIATPVDDVVHITLSAQVAARPPFSPASFLRALRTNTPVPGQQAAEVPLPVPADPRAVLGEAQTVAVGPLIGLVLVVRNPGAEPLVLDVRIGTEPGAEEEPSVVRLATWTFPPRLTVKAVAADAELIPPGGQTRVYLILQRRS